MINEFNKLKENLIKTYQRYGSDKMLTYKGKSYSGIDLSKEIQDGTEFGIELITNMIELTIDLVKRDKINNGFSN